MSHFSDYSPGSQFFLQDATKILLRLASILSESARNNGYEEIITPTIVPHNNGSANKNISIHVDDRVYSVKSDNDFGVLTLFGMFPRNHKEMPMRIVDFGVVHVDGERKQVDSFYSICPEEMILRELQTLDLISAQVSEIIGLELSNRVEIINKHDLFFTDKDGNTQKAVLVKRSFYGSIELIMQKLTEKYNGRWPFSLSPRQICIIPSKPHNNIYAEKLYNQFRKKMLHTDIFRSDGTHFRIRYKRAQLMNYNYIIYIIDPDFRSGKYVVYMRDKNKTFSVDDITKLIR